MIYYRSGEFAKIIGVTKQTLRNWHDAGTFVPHHVSPGGQRYYSQEQIDKYFSGIKKYEREAKHEN